VQNYQVKQLAVENIPQVKYLRQMVNPYTDPWKSLDLLLSLKAVPFNQEWTIHSLTLSRAEVVGRPQSQSQAYSQD